MVPRKPLPLTTYQSLWSTSILGHDCEILDLLMHPVQLFGSPTPDDRSSALTDFARLSRLRAQRADTPSAAFLRIIYKVHLLSTAAPLNVPLGNEIQNFCSRGVTDTDKPDHFLFGGKCYIQSTRKVWEKTAFMRDCGEYSGEDGGGL